MSLELQALQDADFGWVRSLDSVWSDETADAGPNEDLVDGIITELAKLMQSHKPAGPGISWPGWHRQDTPHGRAAPQGMDRRLLVRDARRSRHYGVLEERRAELRHLSAPANAGRAAPVRGSDRRRRPSL